VRLRVRDRRALLPYIRRRDEANAKYNERYGYDQIGPLTKQQQEACVAASATVGAFLRYICRRDKRNAAQNKRFGYGGDVVSAEQQAR
jgi:hypothetical protein